MSVSSEEEDYDNATPVKNRLISVQEINSFKDLQTAWKELQDISWNGKDLEFPILYKSAKTRSEWLKKLSQHSKHFLPAIARNTRFEDYIVSIVDMTTRMHGAVCLFLHSELVFALGQHYDTISASDNSKLATGEVPDLEMTPEGRTFLDPTGAVTPTYFPTVVAEVGWSETVASLEASARAYLAHPAPIIRAVILVKLHCGSPSRRSRARIRSNGDVAMRMKAAVVTAAAPNPVWVEFGSDLVRNPNGGRDVARVTAAGPTLNLNMADLYDTVPIPAGLPAAITIDLFRLQQKVHWAFKAFNASK